jgi:arylsulfatase A-like enzyme
MPGSRPNILLIYSDQHRYDCVGVNGHRILQTPGIDRIAREGMNFQQAYTPIPICVPARVSLLTGQWAPQHGVINNFDAESFKGLPPDTRTSFSAIRDAGYRTVHIGRWHADPQRTPLDFGAHEYIPESCYDTWREAQAVPKHSQTGGWMGSVDAITPPDKTYLHWSADQVIGWLTRHREHEEPFFMRWQMAEPHLPCRPPEAYAERYENVAIPPWPGFADDLANKPFMQKQMRRTWAVEDMAWEDWAPIVRRYFGVIAEIDHNVGRVLDALDDLSLAHDTVVVYTTDHGDMCGSHGMVDKHGIMYDDVVRVPMMMRAPGRIEAGSVCRRFVSNAVDLAGTFCELAGAEALEGFAGLSLVPLMGEPAGEWPRNDIFATYHGNQFGGYSQRMVRDERWKYVWNATDVDELYDLEADPGEIVNRAGDGACADELARLRARLVAWMQQTRDPLLNTWTRGQLLHGRKFADAGC